MGKNAEKVRAAKIVALLKQEYPEALCSLTYDKDWHLLFATRLSAQCTDERVNMVTPGLFARWPTLEALAEADLSELEDAIHSCGFFRSKARDIKACAAVLLEKHGGAVPGTMEELLALPGVGRKTANLILGDIFGRPAIVADTHCIRISNKLGLAHTKDPHGVEKELRELIEPAEGSDFCHRLVLHGRAVCTARSPACERCVLAPLCQSRTNG
jgi:endonuclease-3